MEGDNKMAEYTIDKFEYDGNTYKLQDNISGYSTTDTKNTVGDRPTSTTGNLGSKLYLVGVTATTGTVAQSYVNNKVYVYYNELYSNDTKCSLSGHTHYPSLIGLGNVENKSSATIRGELTKANIVSALGYTPPKSGTDGSISITTCSVTFNINKNASQDGSISFSTNANYGGTQDSTKTWQIRCVMGYNLTGTGASNIFPWKLYVN